MTVGQIAAAIEEIAPCQWQQEWDNSGLQVGRFDMPVSGILLTLDVTPQALEMAQTSGANLIVSHHPLIFSGLRTLTGKNEIENLVMSALEKGIAIYSCHTNVDSSPDGVNHSLARILGLGNVTPLCPSQFEGVGMGAVGEFVEPISIEELMQLVKQKLSLKVIRHNITTRKHVKRIALCGGSGASLINETIAAGADALLSGDFKYHDFQRNEQILLIDVGHYESEVHVLEIFYNQICEKFPIFADRIQCNNQNSVIYYL